MITVYHVEDADYAVVRNDLSQQEEAILGRYKSALDALCQALRLADRWECVEIAASAVSVLEEDINCLPRGK